MTRQILKNYEYDKLLKQDGFVVIPQLITDTKCQELLKYALKAEFNTGQPFSMTNWLTDNALRTNAHKFILSKVETELNEFVDRYIPQLAVYSVKSPKPASAVKLHQDWTMIDESRSRSISFWIALQDIDTSNGALQVIRGSQHTAGFPRGVNIRYCFEDVTEELLDGFAESICVKKGDAIVFDHALIHGSLPNVSLNTRMAIVIALKPAEEKLLHYYKDPLRDGQLEILEIEETDFHLLGFINGPQRPKYKQQIGVLKLAIPQLELTEIVNKPGNKVGL